MYVCVCNGLSHFSSTPNFCLVVPGLHTPSGLTLILVQNVHVEKYMQEFFEVKSMTVIEKNDLMLLELNKV